MYEYGVQTKHSYLVGLVLRSFKVLVWTAVFILSIGPAQLLVECLDGE